MATLYTHQTSNIVKTWLIFGLFLILVMGLGFVFTEAFGNPLILYVAIIFSVVMSITSYWYSDKIVLSMAHASPVTKENAHELYNIVENLSITAGLPVPRIYIIKESAPNAFATGRDANHAVVAVTTGLLDRLDRSELEGVIAHELSHVGNQDILVSTIVVVLVGFISMASDFFLRSLFWGSMGGGESRDRDGVHPAMIMTGLILALLTPLTATLMQLAISRKREFLADASGALLTRYPDGLARALIKISTDPTNMKFSNNTTAHLWIDDPFKGKAKTSWFHKLFMTHPPVEERVKALKGIEF